VNLARRFARRFVHHVVGRSARRSVRHTALVVCALVATAACHPEFNPKLYPNPETLFAVGLKELNAKHWENATKAFDQLTRDLPARDPLLPPSYFYLGQAQGADGDHLLAAQSFNRVADAFPEDSLAPVSLYQAGREYSQMWRRSDLDPQYGVQAQNTLSSLEALYPDSKYMEQAKALLAHLDGMFAEKDFLTGYSYYRRHAYDSGIIYFKDVIRLHPTAPATRNAYLYLLDSYRKINYRDDATETCEAMLKAYPGDKEISNKCGSVSSAAASTPRT